MPTFKPIWIMPFVLAAVVFVYAQGLHGPFLFDDNIHIAQNRWVKIESLSWADLTRAWNSSFTNRPLAQLSFGVNHALAGLEPWAFKSTNLAIHLLTGAVVFLFARLVYRVLNGAHEDRSLAVFFALAAAAFWLLHPMHISTVLYTVQRMAQISTLCLLAALTSYFHGRIRISEGRSGAAWIVASVPIALLGFLGKENAALLPLLLLVSELTLLRRLPVTQNRYFVWSIWLLFIAVPIIVAIAYFAANPGYFHYGGRPFTIEERLLTQPRVLWLYLKWLYVPDIAAYGLFHDDIVPSTGLTSPPSTLIAIIALMSLLVAAILSRHKAPIFAFAALFFLASHALESTAFPLEMVFEHRNYLASVGPLLLLAHVVVVSSGRLRIATVARLLGVLLLISYASVTYLRAGNWSSYQQFALSAAQHHPHSPRSNFIAAQVLISAIAKNPAEAPALADLTRTLLQNALAADPRCINCLFGLVVLDLHLEKPPGPDVLDRLRTALRSGPVDPTKISVSQFSFLVKWHQSDGYKLAAADLESIFEAALANPRWNHTGRAGIEAAYRNYFEQVAHDLESALVHARAAVDAWPKQWSYHIALARVLGRLERIDEAEAALDNAARVAGNEAQQRQTAEARAALAQDSRN